MKRIRLAGSIAAVAVMGLAISAQTPATKKKLLVIGEEKGYRHEAVTHAMVTIDKLGRETGLWDTVIRTDTEALTKKKLEYNAKNLNDFDAVVFYTGGTLEMDDQTAGRLPVRSSTTTAKGSSASTARRSRLRNGPTTAR